MNDLVSKTGNFRFKTWKNEDTNHFLLPRDGEVKIGENLTALADAKYVIIGVEESIGPRANAGRGGAENGFEAFVSSFVNMQSNEFLLGEKAHILGRISVLNEQADLKQMVSELDDFLLDVLTQSIHEKQIPIVIGGGHNNAYPLMKFSHLRSNDMINVVNLDAHADYRLLEGRHSGNAFSYAFRDGLIHKYFVMGLHHQYNSQQILDDLRRDKHYFTFHDDYVIGKRSYKTDFEFLGDSLQETKRWLGVELDLDVIRDMPSSASSPVGIALSTARKYLKTVPLKSKVAYLHLPEGAPYNEKEKRTVGKTLAYLVTDFISTCNDSHIERENDM